VSKEEANKTLEKWEKTYREAKQKYDAAVKQAEQKARDAAEASAKAVSLVAVMTFASLVLGAVVAAVGGYVGSVYKWL
jgi:F0F1-type ATP synthase membrane subunit b/b'